MVSGGSRSFFSVYKIMHCNHSSVCSIKSPFAVYFDVLFASAHTGCSIPAADKMTNTIRFKVTFKNIEFKDKAKSTLKALPGVDSVELDQKHGELKRKLTVNGGEDAKLLMNILKIYGSVHKLIVFRVSFKDQKCKSDALMTAKALKGVVSAELDDNPGKLERKLTVIGDPDRKILQQILEIFGTAQLIP